MSDCVASGAGAQSASPAWFASTMQVPASVKVTTPLVETLHTPVPDVGSTEKVTASPDVAVALGE